MTNINYCNHSKNAFIYHWLLVNEAKHGGFNDKAYEVMLADIKETGNSNLFNQKGTINTDQLKEEVYEMSDRIWDGL